MKKRNLKIINIVTLVAIMIGVCYVAEKAYAEEAVGGLTTFDFMPFRLITVKGDAAKFRALNWMNDGITGGIKDMTYDGKIGKDGHFFFEGHAIPGDNDFGTSLKLTKGNGGYITMDYGNFRKWYDIYGGYFPNFVGTPIYRMAPDPAVDMGHFNLEIGRSSEDNKGFSLGYERETKDGIKSRLTWGSAIEGITRKIIPSSQDIGEVVDVIELKGNTGVAGFNVSGKQRAEFHSARTLREDTGTATVERTSEEPQTKQLVSSLKADRWMMNDKTYVGFGYQFQHLTSDALVTILNFDPTTRLPTSESHNGTIIGQASRDSHSLVQHLTANLTPNLNFSTKFKEEIVASTGNGFRQGFLGGSDRFDESENSIGRTGQSLSLRYSGLPKTSLYTDWDFQQTRQWLSKYSRSTTTSYTEYVDSDPEMTGVIGARYTPNSKFSATSNLRLKTDHNTYNYFANSDTGVSISRIQTESNEWSNKATWKPTKWLQNSFRLQLLNTVYSIQSIPTVDIKSDWNKSNANARIYTYDISLQPSDVWMFDLGASLNQFKVSTPASQKAVSAGGIPVFESDFVTLLLSTSYVPKENLSLYGSAQYTYADNYDSQSFFGIPYGVNNEHYDVTLGVKWAPKENVSIEPHYAYYSYRANPDDGISLDYGNYSAHVYWLDTKFTW